MYLRFADPKFHYNYRILQALRFKGNNIDLVTCKSEIEDSVNYFNKVVQTPAHANTKQIFAVEIFTDFIAIFLSTDNKQDDPGKGLQLYSSYYTKNNTKIGSSAKNGKLFVKADDPVELTKISTDFDMVNIIMDVLLKPNPTQYEKLKKQELSNQIGAILKEGYGI